MEKESGKQRVAIFLDGSNFYHRIKDNEVDFKQSIAFDYKSFAEWLAYGRHIVSLTYYVWLVRKEQGNIKSEELVKNQQKLFASLEKQGWRVKTGYMMKQNNLYKEKGVDVKIAVDLLDMAYQNKYDIGIVVSSDTDLIPSIERCHGLGKKIEYIGFSHRPSFAMQRYADSSRLLTKHDLEQFLPKL